jgi:hypothetical protein
VACRRNQKKIVSAALAVLAVAVAVGIPQAGVAAGASRSARDCVPAWRVVASPNVVGGALSGVSARSGDDVWAVGGPYRWPQPSTESGALHSTLAEHWDGTAWALVATPRLDGFLADVVSTGADHAWAVGVRDRAHPSGLVEHWDGGRWAQAAAPPTTGLSAVAALSDDDVWAVGSGTNDAAVVLHWNGNSWHQVLSRPHEELADVVALSSTDVWAVGSDADRYLALHWNGVRWRVLLLRRPGNDHNTPRLVSVAAFSTDDVWVAGSATPNGFMPDTNDQVVFQWNGRAWSRRTPRNGLDPELALGAIAAGAPHQVWLTGTDIEDWTQNAGEGSFLGRWYGSRWQYSALATGDWLDALTSDTNGTLWAVGLRGSGIRAGSFPGRTTPLIEQTDC